MGVVFILQSRESSEAELGFDILGGSQDGFPIYISTVTLGSAAEERGVKRGLFHVYIR